MIYDLIIVGGGAAGVMAALEIAARTDLTVAVLEKARRLNDARNIGYCWMGGSARSAARLFESAAVGGCGFSAAEYDLFLDQFQHFYGQKLKFRSAAVPKSLIKTVEAAGFTAPQQKFATLNEEAFIRASDRMHTVLRSNINIYHKVDVLEINLREADEQTERHFHIATDDVPYMARNVILATGRSSQGWFENVLNKNFTIDFSADSYQLGMRIEMPATHFDRALSKDWDRKLYWGEWQASIPIRKSNVETEESWGDLKTANSRTTHSGKKSYLSFSIRHNIKSATPAADQYRLCALANVLFDQQLSREPTSKLLDQTSPLAAIPEYAAFAEPILALSKLVPEIATKSMVYGPEVNLNVRQYEVDHNGQTKIPGLYMVGDMTGQTCSFVQAACSGIRAALALVNTAPPEKVKTKREVLRYDIIESAAKGKRKKADTSGI